MTSCRATASVLLSIGVIVCAVRAEADDSRWAVYVMKPDGSQVRKVVEASNCLDHSSPRWSHDGRQIAFDAVSRLQGNRQLFVVDAGGANLRNLGSNARPDWSPDDKQIAYEVYGGGRRVFVQNTAGGGETAIADGVCGRWSPDGSRLAVTDHHNVRIIDLVTGEEQALFDTPYDNIYGGYNWSPDGKRLALTAETAELGGGKRPLLLVDVDKDPPKVTMRMQSGQGGSVSFSPDGKRLAIDDNWLIQILDIEGNRPPKIVPGQKGKNKDPHWSPDGEWIVFCSDRT